MSMPSSSGKFQSGIWAPAIDINIAIAIAIVIDIAIDIAIESGARVIHGSARRRRSAERAECGGESGVRSRESGAEEKG